MTSDKPFHIKAGLLISSVSILIYSNTLFNDFTFDDFVTIFDNSFIRDINNLRHLFGINYFIGSGENSYRPVVTFTYFIEYYLYGLNPFGYHLTNVLLHCANGVVLYIFLTLALPEAGIWELKMTRIPISRPLLVSLIFASHPVLTEAVNAISFREDLLFFLFYTSTLAIYLHIRPGSSTDAKHEGIGFLYAFSCLIYLLALFSKEMAVTLPLIILAYEYICEKATLKALLFNRYNLGYAAITVSYGYLRFFKFQNPYDVTSLITTKFTWFKITAHYIRLVLFPVNLCADYYQYGLSWHLDPEAAFSLLLILFLLATALILKAKKPLASFGIIFFLLTLLPVSNFIPTKTLIAERFLYLPACGLLLSFATLSTEALRKGNWFRKTGMILFLSILLTFASLTFMRNFVWKDQFSLWSDTVKKMPGNSRAYYNLALSTSDLKEKINALKMALYLNPVDDKARSKLADTYVLEGNYGNAIKLYSDILRRSPDNTDILHRLASAYFSKGDIYESRDILEKLVESHRNNPEMLNDLGGTYGALKKYDESIKTLTEAIAISPRYLDAYYNLGIVYRKSRKFDKAIAIYSRAMEMDPSPEKAYMGLGDIYLEKENYPTAIEMYKKAINFNHTNVDAYYNIAYLYVLQKEFDSSLYWLKRAVDAGLKDIGSLKTDKVFTSLTGRGDFKELAHK